METKEYLVKNIKTLLETATELDKVLAANSEAIKTIMIAIASRKRNEENLKPSDVSKDLEEVQEKHYTNFFLEQNMKNVIVSVKELTKMAEELKIDTELTEDEIMKVNFIKENNTDLFTVINGRLEVADQALYKQITEGLKQKLAQEGALKSMFDSIQ